MNFTRASMAVSAALFAANASASGLGIGDPAPPVAVSKWVQGDPVKAGPGGLRVFEFWATWCGPCKESIPHLSELAKKYKGKVTFTGVDISEETSNPVQLVAKFVKDMGPKMSYNVAVDGATATMSKTWMQAAHQNGIPTAFVVDRTGTVVWIGHPMFGLDEALGQLVAGKYDVKKAKTEYVLAQQKEAEEEKKQAAEEQKMAADQAAMQAIGQKVEQAASDYKTGKKAEALASFDKVQATAPLKVQQQIRVYKFSLWYPDNRTAAKAYAEKNLADAKDDASMLMILYGAAAGMQKASTAEDKAYGLSMADRAIKTSPTNPVIEFEASMFYLDNKQQDKATDLAKDALKNIGNAPAEIQTQLKKAIEDKLASLQPKAAPAPAAPAPTTPAPAPTKP